MKKLLKPLTLALILSASTGFADSHQAVEKPFISTSQQMQLTAVVEAIDLDKREVTLRGPQGGQRTITLGDTATRLGEVEVGDTVLVEFLQNLTIEVMANDGMEPGSGSMSAIGRAPEDAAPGVMVAETAVETATVEEINLEDSTFKLKWGDGTVKSYVARDPANLKKADVGDLVVVSYTEALALSLQEVPAE